MKRKIDKRGFERYEKFIGAYESGVFRRVDKVIPTYAAGKFNSPCRLNHHSLRRLKQFLDVPGGRN